MHLSFPWLFDHDVTLVLIWHFQGIASKMKMQEDLDLSDHSAMDFDTDISSGHIYHEPSTWLIIYIFLATHISQAMPHDTFFLTC